MENKHTQNTGGMASPATEQNGINFGEPGMTLRDYFIAHAPAEPQLWFAPVMPPRPASKWTDESYTEEGPFFDSPRKAEQHFGTCEEFITNVMLVPQALWDADCKKQRYIQWPAAWADAQLAERDKSRPSEVLTALSRLLAQCDRLRMPGMPESDAEKFARQFVTPEV